MNAAAEVKHKERFDLEFASPEAQTLAYILFVKKPSLANVLEKELGGTFGQRPRSIDPKTDPIKSATFWGPEGCGEKMQKIIDVLISDVKEDRYMSKETVNEIAYYIKENGYYLPQDKGAKSKFNKKAANGNVPEQPQQPHVQFVPKTPGQDEFAQQILANRISFGIGPAGTGKTHVAVALAVDALRNGDINKIIITRPAVEAGEKIGFLPGTEGQKLEPYLRPIYDILEEMLGFDTVKKMMERNVLQLAPIGFMRGRTFNDAFVIVDEAQNTTREQLKMALTRVGRGSKMVITGDQTQIDLKGDVKSGLMDMVNDLEGLAGIGKYAFSNNESVRDPIVTMVLNRLDEKDAQRTKPAPQPTVRKPS